MPKIKRRPVKFTKLCQLALRTTCCPFYLNIPQISKQFSIKKQAPTHTNQDTIGEVELIYRCGEHAQDKTDGYDDSASEHHPPATELSH